MPDAIPAKTQVLALIVNLRRNVDTEGSWATFRRLIQRYGQELFRNMDTRQLVSLCDTIADYGSPVEQRNAMLVSVFVNMEKLAQSYLLWREGYNPEVFEPPTRESARKIPLWDGMDTFHVEIGDVTNSMFARLKRLLKATPDIELIFDEVVDRMRKHPTILSALDKIHGHVFAHDTVWRADGKYDRYRQSGDIPPWKNDIPPRV